MSDRHEGREAKLPQGQCSSTWGPQVSSLRKATHTTLPMEPRPIRTQEFPSGQMRPCPKELMQLPARLSLISWLSRFLLFVVDIVSRCETITRRRCTMAIDTMVQNSRRFENYYPGARRFDFGLRAVAPDTLILFEIILHHDAFFLIAPIK
jgi:hypothetical protein